MLEEPASLRLFQFGLLDDIIKQLSLLDVLHNQEQMLGRLDDLHV